MALKALMLRRNIEAKAAELEALQQQDPDFEARETSLTASIEEAVSAEERSAVEAEIDRYDADLRAHQEAVATASADLEQLRAQLAEIEASKPAVPTRTDVKNERMNATMNHEIQCNIRALPKRQRAFEAAFTRQERKDIVAQDDVQKFFADLRSMSKVRASVTGAELAVPMIFLDLISENIYRYSKLLNRVRVRDLNGKGRQTVAGVIPEAVWTEMCAALNELNFDFKAVEVDGYKVGGYIPVDNYLLDDSDIALGEEIILMLGQAIGYALDKAIVYGKGPSYKMPVGIATRLAASSQPAWWGTNQGTFTDLHSSNVITLNIAGSTGTAFFQPLLAALGKAKPKYSAGRATWIMSHKTHMDLLGRALTFNAAGSLVAGIRDQMPVESGDIVQLEFIPDNEIVGGFLDVYVLAERDGGRFGASDLPLFLQDKTVFKATARYDGQPARGEAFVIVNYNNTSPTTAKDFATDYANEAMNALICTAAAGGSVGKTVVTVSGAVAGSPTLKYAVAYQGSIAVGDTVGTAFADLTSGTTAITAGAGTPITVVELDSNSRVISMGTVGSVPKTS